MNNDTNITPMQTGRNTISGYTPTFQQMPCGQNIGLQPAPLQTLPLFLQTPTQQQQMMQQPTQQQQMMQQPAVQMQRQQALPMQQIFTQAELTSMDRSSPATTMPSVQFTQFEELPILDGNIPITAESLQYLNGFLRTQIGRRVKVEFLIGTNQFVDKEGILIGVGINYIIINETDTDDITACDFYNIKFIRIYF